MRIIDADAHRDPGGRVPVHTRMQLEIRTGDIVLERSFEYMAVSAGGCFSRSINAPLYIVHIATRRSCIYIYGQPECMAAG